MWVIDLPVVCILDRPTANGFGVPVKGARCGRPANQPHSPPASEGGRFFHVQLRHGTRDQWTQWWGISIVRIIALESPLLFRFYIICTVCASLQISVQVLCENSTLRSSRINLLFSVLYFQMYHNFQNNLESAGNQLANQTKQHLVGSRVTGILKIHQIRGFSWEHRGWGSDRVQILQGCGGCIPELVYCIILFAFANDVNMSSENPPHIFHGIQVGAARRPV